MPSKVSIISVTVSLGTQEIFFTLTLWFFHKYFLFIPLNKEPPAAIILNFSDELMYLTLFDFFELLKVILLFFLTIVIFSDKP